MILNKEFEVLENLHGNNKIVLDDLLNKAIDMSGHWVDHKVPSYGTAMPIRLTEDAKVGFFDSNTGTSYEEDISAYAFTQLCSKAGIPASYTKKCFDNGKGDLAQRNYLEWANDEESDGKPLLVRSYDGVTRAVLSDRYNVFDSGMVLQNLVDAIMERPQYEANQAHLSIDRLHIRFVNFNDPLTIGNDRLHYGFTVSSSDIGSGSLSVKYFLYRFACKNGLVIVKKGGTLFRQTHLNDFANAGKEMFLEAFDKIDILNQECTDQILKAQNKILTEEELAGYITRARKELHLGKTGEESLMELVNNTYDRTLWGVINSVTENAQRYSLDERLENEAWAGNLLQAA